MPDALSDAPSGPAADAPPDPRVPQIALWTASAHAAEARRQPPCVHDPFAAEFLAAARFTAGPPGSGLLGRLLPDWMVVRTRFFDEYLLSATRSGCRQVVLLGAGLDARAFRLDWPAGVHLFEIDEPAVCDFKDGVLGETRPACGRRTTVRADPAGPWDGALLAAGFDPARPTAWLCETMLYHLDPGVVDAVVGTMGRLSAPGSAFAAECVNAAAADSPFVAPFLDGLSATGLAWRWLLADPKGWWGAQGWDAQVADLFTLPYAVRRFSSYLPMLNEAAADCVFLTTGTRSHRPG